jgi:hypothetical protein
MAPAMNELFQTGSKKPRRGMAQASIDLIHAMYRIPRTPSRSLAAVWATSYLQPG